MMAIPQPKLHKGSSAENPDDRAFTSAPFDHGWPIGTVG